MSYGGVGSCRAEDLHPALPLKRRRPRCLGVRGGNRLRAPGGIRTRIPGLKDQASCALDDRGGQCSRRGSNPHLRLEGPTAWPISRREQTDCRFQISDFRLEELSRHRLQSEIFNPKSSMFRWRWADSNRRLPGANRMLSRLSYTPEANRAFGRTRTGLALLDRQVTRLFILEGNCSGGRTRTCTNRINSPAPYPSATPLR